MEDFDLTVLLQEDQAPVTSRGVLYLTNIQRLYESSASTAASREGINPVEAMVGPRVNPDLAAGAAEGLFDRVAGRGRVMVVNDEAHHVCRGKAQVEPDDRAPPCRAPGALSQ